ncbi:MAG: DUF72 domain-containing protein [Calditrichaeota bacterium]|nr:DUF72 domain-containing protein [Calditrichota bacterium]
MSLTGSLFAESRPANYGRYERVVIGTSGYLFPDWQGTFYPPGLPRREWLGYYARHFNVLEVNASYYGLPSPSTFASMAARTPDDFNFWVKVPGGVTHGSDDFEVAMGAFREAVKPLREAGRLEGALAQFPPSFRPETSALSRIGRMAELAGTRLAVEFRRRDWQTSTTYDFLDRNGIVSVMVDMPAIDGLPISEARVTGGIGYVRFHGRNHLTWYDRAAGDRYDYDYSEAELESWQSPVEAMEEGAQKVFIFFNNCHLGNAVRGARLMTRILRGESALFT